MFSFSRVKKFLLAGFVILAMTVFMGGCDSNPSGDDQNLGGTWTSTGGDGYTINTSNNTIEYPNNFIGTIVNSPDYTAPNGVLIFQITKYWDADHSNWPDSVYTETTANNGKYAATYWRNLTHDQVQMASAWIEQDNWVHVMFNTLTEAQTNFTMDRVNIYIGMWGTYTK